MADLAVAVSLDRQIECVEREIRLRGRVYPRWIKAGKLNADAAQEEMESMHAVLETLLQVRRRAPS